jgi:hypothetical protein
MEQEQVLNVDPAEYHRLVDADAKLKKRCEQIKARNYEKILCDGCGVYFTRGNRIRHEAALPHKTSVVKNKLLQIKDCKITQELIDEMVQLLS